MSIIFAEKRKLAEPASNYGLIALITLGVMSAAMGITNPGSDVDAMSLDERVSQVVATSP